jgi:hypothetical protein
MEQTVSDAQLWSLVVGFLLPNLIAVAQRPWFPTQMRVVVAIAFSAISGAGTAYFVGNLDGRTFVSCTLVILVTAISTYQMVWRQLKIAPRIEAWTTFGKATVVEAPLVVPLVVKKE